MSFYYDGKGLATPQSPNYAKGKLTKVTSNVSETQYQLFDNFGRMTQMSQITDGQTYTSKYAYNLSGAVGFRDQARCAILLGTEARQTVYKMDRRS